MELQDTNIRRGINIVSLQQIIKWVGEKSRQIENMDIDYGLQEKKNIRMGQE